MKFRARSISNAESLFRNALYNTILFHGFQIFQRTYLEKWRDSWQNILIKDDSIGFLCNFVCSIDAIKLFILATR